MRLPRFRPTTPRGVASRAFGATVMAVAWLLLGASGAAASTHTWIGPSGGLWSNAGNWSGGVPTSGEPGGTIVAIGSNASSLMDIDGLTVDQLAFTGSGATIDALGKTLSLDGSNAVNNIDSAGPGNSLGAGLTLRTVGGSDIFVRSQAGQFTFIGPIAGDRPMTFATSVGAVSGTGTTFRGSNTFTGAVTVANGVLTLDNLGVNTAITGSSLQIGTGVGPGATLKLAQALEIADATDVNVLVDGTFDVNGAVDRFRSLTVLGGTVSNLPFSTPALSVDQLEMVGGTIESGGVIDVAGTVTATSNSDGPATIDAPLRLASGDFDVSDGPNAVDLLLTRGIGQQSGALSVAKRGNGAMRVASSTASTYAGTTAVVAGTLELAGTGAALVPGTALTIGGSASGATLKTGSATDVPAATAVTVQSDGVADLSAANQGLTALTVNGGTVALDTRTLTLGGPLAMAGGSITGASAAQLVLGGNVTATSSASSGAVIGVALALAGARTFTVAAGAVKPELKLGGNIANGAGTGAVTKVGAGTMLMQPPSGNSYTGPTAVKDGRLQVNSPSTPSIPTGALTIGDGIGAAGSAVVEALVNADITAPTTINADGLLDMDAFGQNLPSLTINDGGVRTASGADFFTNLLSMTGGAITGAGTMSIAGSVPPTMTLTSSAKGPARIAITGTTFINASTTMTVNGGVAPEVTVAGGIQLIGQLTKQGTGTALLKGSMVNAGTLSVNAGTVVAEQPLELPATVALGATFEPRSVFGASTVNGTLRAGPSTTANGNVSFGPTGVLRVAVPSAVAAEAPSLKVNGTVTIAGGATLNLSVANGVIIQPGTTLKLITNDVADAITGQFANAPAGPFTEPSGHRLSIAYATGTGNDLEATVVAVPPTPTPSPTATPTATPSPSATPTPSATSTPTPTPTSAPGTKVPTPTLAPAPTPAAGPAASAKPASLSRLRLSPKAFRAATSGGPIAPKASSRSTTVRFTLTVASTIEFAVSRELPGIRSGATCVAPPKRKPAKAKRCTRLVAVGTFSTEASAGEASLRFTGRVGPRALATGSYVLTARPTGGVASTTRFTILKAARR